MADTPTPRTEEGYVGQIKGGLRPAMRIVVMGIIHKKPKSMMVTLSCPPRGEGDEEQEGDVGLQMTIKFMEKAVVRNSRVSGKWGTSEGIISFFPFAAGESFKMEIVCEHQQFRILVDGQPLCGFTHRVTQLASLTSLRVGGDLQLTKIA
ncbi:galectin-related protein B [Clarias gariepinus]|uniref:galectin-related protein A-like n=1 Tax=Clarias gariepinus TaxID=13013 RepID=UPI00234D0728|nr:galectin-related protein A-like [Clarias gariepinus]